MRGALMVILIVLLILVVIGVIAAQIIPLLAMM